VDLKKKVWVFIRKVFVMMNSELSEVPNKEKNLESGSQIEFWRAKVTFVKLAEREAINVRGRGRGV
jgi:hypothetical protein